MEALIRQEINILPLIENISVVYYTGVIEFFFAYL